MSDIKSEKKQTRNPILGVQAVEVIKIKVSSGAGTPEDPARLGVQYWNKNGKFIGKEDPYVEALDKSNVSAS